MIRLGIVKWTIDDCHSDIKFNKSNNVNRMHCWNTRVQYYE